jgi:hypothetical protein
VPGECIKVSAAELGCASGLTSAIVRAAIYSILLMISV